MKTETNYDNLNLLGKETWVNDYGLMKAIDSKPGNTKSSYYKNEQNHKYLWDLITYMDNTKQSVIDYYNLPEDTEKFIIWVFSNVNRSYFKNNKEPPMNNMPFKKLYKDVHIPLNNGKDIFQI